MKVFTCVKIAHTQCGARSNEQTIRKPNKKKIKTKNNDDEQLMGNGERLGAIKNRFIAKIMFIIFMAYIKANALNFPTSIHENISGIQREK